MLYSKIHGVGGIDGSITEYADACRPGLVYVHTVFETTDVPQSKLSYHYCPGIILVRKMDGEKCIILINCGSCKLAINSKSQDKDWIGWREI